MGPPSQESQAHPDGPPLAIAFSPSRFRPLRRIGQGGMGEIQLAMDHQLGRQVALKFPRWDREAQDVRMLLEARYQAAIRHPNVVPVYEVGFLENRACIVMAYIDGPNLWEARGSLSLQDSVRLVAQAAHGVHAAHCAGLIHQDLKPENILVDEPEGGGFRAYVADFGLARQEDQDKDQAWGEGSNPDQGPVGTLGFMSPEQLAGDPILDPRTDVYSLGAILYALCTGRPPLDLGTAGSMAGPEEGSEPQLLSRKGPRPAELLRRIQETPPGPRSLVPGLDPDLDTIVVHAMEYDPHRRYASARDLAEDLDRYLAGEPIKARRPTWTYRLGRFAARNRALAGLAAALVLGLLMTAGGFLVLAQRNRARALLAQRYAMWSQQIEQHIRLAHMLPPHDRTPQIRWARERMEELRAAAAREGLIAQGPFGYLAGTTDLIMDRPQEAQVELERAWNLGYRTPMVAQALGEAVMEARLQGVMIQGPQRGLGPEGTRALAFLKQARLSGTFTPILEARIAQIEGREEEAIGFCRQALAQTPWAYEAHIQIGEVRLNSMHRAGHFEELEAIFAGAVAEFDAAIAMAPSDPKPVLLKAYAIRQLERRRVEIGLGLNQDRLRSAIRLCDLAERLDPGFARVFGERSLLRCVLVAQGGHSSTGSSLENDPVAMLRDGLRAHDLDPRLEIAQAALAWAFQTQGGNAFRRRTPTRSREIEDSEASLRNLLAAHPSTAPLHKALAYALWTKLDFQQEAGLDPRPAFRDMLTHLKTSMELQSQRLWFMGEQIPDYQELGERLTYQAELEHAWGDPRAAQAALDAGMVALNWIQDKQEMMVSLPFLRAWNRLLQAQLLMEAGQDHRAAAREAEIAMAGASPVGLDRSYNRIPRTLPCHLKLLEAQKILRQGGDPRPLWEACVRDSFRELRRSPGVAYPLYGLLLASIQEVRYCLGRGLDASGPAKACRAGARRLDALERRGWPTEPSSRLAEFGRLHGDLVLASLVRGGQVDAGLLRSLNQVEAGHPVLTGSLFMDPAWLEWLAKPQIPAGRPQSPPSHPKPPCKADTST